MTDMAGLRERDGGDGRDVVWVDDADLARLRRVDDLSGFADRFGPPLRVGLVIDFSEPTR